MENYLLDTGQCIYWQSPENFGDDKNTDGKIQLSIVHELRPPEERVSLFLLNFQKRLKYLAPFACSLLKV